MTVLFPLFAAVRKNVYLEVSVIMAKSKQVITAILISNVFLDVAMINIAATTKNVPKFV